MKGQLKTKSRKEIQTKLATVFGANIQTLSTDYQKILIDDLVTAFENRLAVLNRVQCDVQTYVEVSDRIKLEDDLV
jgi:hypothetical protein